MLQLFYCTGYDPFRCCESGIITHIGLEIHIRPREVVSEETSQSVSVIYSYS